MRTATEEGGGSRGALPPPLRQQPHASRAEDVERRLFVFVPRDVSGGEAEQRLQVEAGLRRRLRQGGDS